MEVYITPEKVISPKRKWVFIAALDPAKAKDCALALGRWDGEPVLAMRWNGDTQNPIGNPQSRGLPTWFILPRQYYTAILRTLPPDKITLAKNFFPKISL